MCLQIWSIGRASPFHFPWWAYSCPWPLLFILAILVAVLYQKTLECECEFDCQWSSSEYSEESNVFTRKYLHLAMAGGGLEWSTESLVPFLCIEIILDLETIVHGLALQNWSTSHAVIYNTGCDASALWEGWDTYEWIRKLKRHTSICTCQQCSLCRGHGHIKRLSIHCQWTNDSQGDRNISNHIFTVSSLEKSSKNSSIVLKSV